MINDTEMVDVDDSQQLKRGQVAPTIPTRGSPRDVSGARRGGVDLRALSPKSVFGMIRKIGKGKNFLYAKLTTPIFKIDFPEKVFYE